MAFRVMLAALVALLSVAPANAAVSEPLQVFLMTSPTDPVMLSRVTFMRGPASYPMVATCYTLVNRAGVAATAVEVREYWYDAFDQQLQAFSEQRTGLFAPNVPIEGPPQAYFFDPEAHDAHIANCFKEYSVWPQLHAMRIFLGAVRFADGTVWKRRYDEGQHTFLRGPNDAWPGAPSPDQSLQSKDVSPAEPSGKAPKPEGP